MSQKCGNGSSCQHSGSGCGAASDKASGGAQSGNKNNSCSGCGNTCGGGCSNGCQSGGWESGKPVSSGTCWCGTNCSGCGGCSGKCSGCSGDCTGCSGACGGSCSGTCSKGCSYTCSGDCKGYCKGTCNDGCLGSCLTACSGECKHLCNVTCISNVAADAYEHLSKHTNKPNKNKSYNEHNIEDGIVLDWLDAEDMRHLFGMIQEEGRRRVLMKTGKYDREDSEHPKTVAQTLTRAEEQLIGIRDEKGLLIDVENEETFVNDFVDDEKHIKKLINMLADNTGKSISLSVGGSSIAEGKKVQKITATTLIEKAIDCYNTPVGINTTSEEGGRDTVEDND